MLGIYLGFTFPNTLLALNQYLAIKLKRVSGLLREHLNSIFVKQILDHNLTLSITSRDKESFFLFKTLREGQQRENNLSLRELISVILGRRP